MTETGEADETGELVRTAIARLGSRGVFVTVVSGPRSVADQVLSGVLSEWDHTCGPLEFEIVAARVVHGLVIATGPEATHHVQTVVRRFLMPYTAFLDPPAVPRWRWRVIFGLVGRLTPGARARRRGP